MSEDYLDYYHAPELPPRADPFVESVRDKLRVRSEIGQRKYGCTLARTDLDLLAWLRHAQEEALDQAVYLERAMHDIRLRMDDGK